VGPTFKLGALVHAFELGYYSYMAARSVSIAELKNKLSAYLGRVRQGEEILVRDRKTPIAKIIPLAAAGDLAAEQAALVAEGKLRAPERPFRESFFKLRAPRMRRADLLRALHAERED
jgi:prevent-host-death family protein